MNRTRLFSLFLVMALVLVAFGQADAAGRIPTQGRLAITNETAKNFSVLARQTYCALSSSQVVTPADSTSTNSYTLTYCPTTVKPPVRVKIQYLGTNKVYKRIYSTSTSGVAAPTATCAFVMDPQNTSGTPVIGDEYDEVFYSAPNISFSGGGSAATFAIEIYQLPDFTYQD